jgi:glutamate N-acetyltransferase/amino-acid N-acetyltransferase
MVLALANGASGVTVASPAEKAVFEAALFEVCNSLCAQIAADGEGATKRVEVRVRGAATFAEARAVTKAIANSNLVKTAMFGNDPNWGRILCAIGYSGARFSKKNLAVSLGNMVVCRGLRPVKFANGRMNRALRGKVVPITVDLARGTHSAIAQTCDFSYDYVRINAEYTT